MKAFLVQHIPVYRCWCRLLRPQREEGCWSTPAVCGLFCCPHLTHYRLSLSWPRNALEQSSRAPCSGESTVCCLVGNFLLSIPGISHSGLHVPSLAKTDIFGERLILGMWHCGAGIWHGSLVGQQAACKEAAALHPKGLRDGNWGFSSHRVWMRKLKAVPPFFLFLLVGFLSPNSSAGGTPSLGTGKHPCRLLTEHQQWIYPPGRRRGVSAASRMH